MRLCVCVYSFVFLSPCCRRFISLTCNFGWTKIIIDKNSNQKRNKLRLLRSGKRKRENAVSFCIRAYNLHNDRQSKCASHYVHCLSQNSWRKEKIRTKKKRILLKPWPAAIRWIDLRVGFQWIELTMFMRWCSCNFWFPCWYVKSYSKINNNDEVYSELRP